MPVIAGSIAALGSVGGALLGGQSAKKSGRAQANVQQYMFNRQQELNAPYMNAGNAALNPLFALYGINAGLPTQAGQPAGTVGTATHEQQAAALQQFYSSPEYTIQKAALDQAQQRQAAAQGTAYSPSAALGSAEIAGKTFGDWRNNLASLGNMGTAGAGVQGAALQNLGTGLSNAYGNIGQAKSGMYNALGQSIADIGGQYGQYKAYQDRTAQLMQLFRPQQAAPMNYGIQLGAMPGFQRFDTGGYSF